VLDQVKELKNKNTIAVVGKYCTILPVLVLYAVRSCAAAIKCGGTLFTGSIRYIHVPGALFGGGKKLWSPFSVATWHDIQKCRSRTDRLKSRKKNH